MNLGWYVLWFSCSADGQPLPALPTATTRSTPSDWNFWAMEPYSATWAAVSVSGTLLTAVCTTSTFSFLSAEFTRPSSTVSADVPTTPTFLPENTPSCW